MENVTLQCHSIISKRLFYVSTYSSRCVVLSTKLKSTSDQTQLAAYNNINNQLYATIVVFINNPNQLSMFRAMLSPILRSTRLCLQRVKVLLAGESRQHRGCVIPQPVNTV